MPNKVSISNDITLQFYPPLMSLHEYFGPTPPGVPPPLYVKIGIAAEIPVPMFWPPGMGLGQNKLTTTVLHKNLPIVQDGHDCGALIIHVQVVPYILNTLTLLHIPFSSRKTNFFSSTVLSQGKCTACATLISWPPAPMTSCWDPVSPPLSSAPTSHLNSCVFTMSWADIIIGWSAVIAGMVLDFVLDKISTGPDPVNYSDLVGITLGKFIPTSREGARDWACKQGLAALTGVVRLAFTDGPADVKISVGAPFLQVELGVGRDADGNYSGAAGVRSVNRSGEAKVDSHGVTTKREQGGMGGNRESSTNSQETGPDGRTTRSSSANSWNPSTWGAPL
jgi:hypothetical protein